MFRSSSLASCLGFVKTDDVIEGRGAFAEISLVLVFLKEEDSGAIPSVPLSKQVRLVGIERTAVGTACWEAWRQGRPRGGALMNIQLNIQLLCDCLDGSALLREVAGLIVALRLPSVV